MSNKRVLLGKVLLWLGLAITVIGVLSYFLQQTPAMAEFDTRLPGLYVSVAGIALGVLGITLEKQRDPVPSLGVKVLPISLVIATLYVGFTYFAYRQEEVRITNGDVTLAGTLLIPNGEGPHPAVVMMHGAGEAVRMGNFAEAQSLVRDGVAALIYDKRGSGNTVGGHARFDGYEALASDGIAAFKYLQSRSDIDPDQIGLWGTSEGGWTAPMAASKIDDTAFLIIVSGGPVNLEEQGFYSLASRLSREGFSEEAVHLALELSGQYNSYIRTGLARDEVVAAFERAQREDWFEAAGFSTTVNEYDDLSEYQLWWRDHIDTDVAPLLEQMEFPILFVLGDKDVKIPSRLVRIRVAGILGAVGHQDFAVKVFPEATHNIVRAAPAGCLVCVPDKITGIGPTLPWFAPGYLDTVSDWVTQRVETAD